MPTQHELNRTFWATLDSSSVFEQYLSYINNDINNDNTNSRIAFCYRFPQIRRDAIREIIDIHCAILGR